jgi:2,3-dihydroxybenzoate decarboxylase
MKRNVTSYLRTNIYETSSGNFATDLLEYHITKVGLDRLLYSIDYPFVTIEEGSRWVESLSVDGTLNHRDFLAFKRETAIQLLRLEE